MSGSGSPGACHVRPRRTDEVGEMTTTTTELAGDAAGVDGSPAPTGRRRGGGGGLGSYLVIRFLLIIPTIFILVTTVFVLMRSTGDPITAALGGGLPAGVAAPRRARGR